jgi:hypothetical protein
MGFGSGAVTPSERSGPAGSSRSRAARGRPNKPRIPSNAAGNKLFATVSRGAPRDGSLR